MKKIFYKSGKGLLIGNWTITNYGVPYLDDMKQHESIQKMLVAGTLEVCDEGQQPKPAAPVARPHMPPPIEAPRVVPVIVQPPKTTGQYIVEKQPAVVVATATQKEPMVVLTEKPQPAVTVGPVEPVVIPAEEAPKKKNRGRPKRSNNPGPSGSAV